MNSMSRASRFHKDLFILFRAIWLSRTHGAVRVKDELFDGISGGKSYTA